MNSSKNLLIEGWREINHSFALINQYQIRELLKNDDFKIYFKDIPFPTPEWNKKNNSSGLKDFEKKISKLSQPSSKLKIEGKKKTIKNNLNYIEPNLESLISNMSFLIEKSNSLLKKDKAISFIEKNFTCKLVSKKLSDLFIND